MGNVKLLKKRIKTTKSTLKITSAMKLVSAAKLAERYGVSRRTIFRILRKEAQAEARDTFSPFHTRSSV